MLFGIRSRLIASHLLVAIVAALAASIYLSLSFERLQVEYHEHALLSSAYALADALETDFGTPHGSLQARNAIAKLASEKPGHFAVLDAAGRVVSSTDALIRPGGRLAGTDQALTGRQQVTVTRGKGDDAEHTVVSVPIEHEGRVVGAVRAWVLEKDYRASLAPIKRVTALALAGVAALSIAISLVLSQALTTPIRRMRQLSRRIAGGDFTTRTQESGADELGELAADLNVMASRLQDLENIRRDFVGNVSHELRSPVSNIRVTSEVLERRAERLGDGSAKLFQTIVHETERLESMINELMELSEIESGALTLDMRSFRLKPMLDELIESISPRADQKGITVGLLADPSIAVEADRARLARAVLNLLDNAVKFTSGGGQVVLSARHIDGEIAIEVTDTGDGINSADLPRIFERFYRADKARHRKGGAGIGLSIVKHITEAHGGTVEAYSEEGRGSTFRIRLPVG